MNQSVSPTIEALSNVLHLTTQEPFNKIKLIDLQRRTGYPSERWCKWFKGQSISEDSLVKASSFLEITPGQLLDLILGRRKAIAAAVAAEQQLLPRLSSKW